MNRNINIALQPLTGVVPSFQFGTWDIEATNWWNLEILGIFDGERYYHFRNVPEFISFILQPQYRGWRWFAHFGGRYDMNFVFDYLKNLDANKYKVEFYCSGSMVLKMSILQGKRSKSRYRLSAHLCDSFRLLPASLASLTQAFDVEHKKFKIDFETMVYGKEMIEYNEQDCRGLYEVLESFFEQTGIRSETFATQSLRYWRKEFQKEPLYQPKDNVSNFVRRSYHGGRVEVFKRRAPKLFAYDVNSMYPYVMQGEIPTRYIGESTRWLDSFYGFIEALVTIPEMYVPPLPVRYEKLYFPCGQIRAVWTTEELAHAQSLGVKIEKVFHAVYFHTQQVFKTFVGKLYGLKKTAAEPTRTIAKYLLNSFYGKFGQHPVKKVFVSEMDAPSGAYPIINPFGIPTGFATFERTSHAAYLLPHIATSITSKARLVLYQQLDHWSFYCDTDSVFTRKSMETGNELGQWSYLGEGEAWFVQPKLYTFKGKWKAKGLNHAQSIEAFVNGDINTYLRRRSVKESLRDGKPACMDVEVIKKLGNSRPKREWIGEETRPWNTSELLKR